MKGYSLFKQQQLLFKTSRLVFSSTGNLNEAVKVRVKLDEMSLTLVLMSHKLEEKRVSKRCRVEWNGRMTTTRRQWSPWMILFFSLSIVVVLYTQVKREEGMGSRWQWEEYFLSEMMIRIRWGFHSRSCLLLSSFFLCVSKGIEKKMRQQQETRGNQANKKENKKCRGSVTREVGVETRSTRTLTRKVLAAASSSRDRFEMSWSYSFSLSSIEFLVFNACFPWRLHLVCLIQKQDCMYSSLVCKSLLFDLTVRQE